MHLSFVRSVTMDKWKDIELEKMKVGGNRKAREFFEDQDDWNESLPISQKYNTMAAALYRDKINTLANGETWKRSEALKRIKSNTSTATSSSSSTYGNQQSPTGFRSISNENYGYQSYTSGYQNSVGSDGTPTNDTCSYQAAKDAKSEFFARRQMENASRPEYADNIKYLILFYILIYIYFYFNKAFTTQSRWKIYWIWLYARSSTEEPISGTY